MTRLTITATVLLTLLVGGTAIAPDGQALKVQGPDSSGNQLPVMLAGPGSTNSFQTQLVATSTGGAQANNCTLAALAGQFTYIAGFDVNGLGATGASAVAITVTGVQGGTLTYNITIPAGTTTAITPLTIRFNPPLRSTAVNTAIVVNVPSFGAGNTVASANAFGFNQL